MGDEEYQDLCQPRLDDLPQEVKNAAAINYK